jgi:hypothetical protein
MRFKPSFYVTTLALFAALVLGGCKSSTPPPAPGQVPNSDGSMPQAASSPANAPTNSAAPAGSGPPAPDSASAPAVQGPASTESAASPTSQRLTAPAGTPVTVTITERLSASHNEVGDRFDGVIAEPVRASGGTIFSRGTRVAGTVVAAKGRGRFKGSGALGIELTSIAGRPVSATEYEKEQAGKGKRSAGFIGGGAGGGALIGGLVGGGKGALLGGLIGAGAGTAGAAFTGNKDIVIPSESRVTFRLRAPLTVTVPSR